MQSIRKVFGCLLASVFAAAPIGAAVADTYPEKPIRVIIPFTPGGGTDITSRQFGHWLEPKLGQTLVIDNRPGAGGTLGAEIASEATPDGYTVFIASASFATAPAMYSKLPYDPIKDFNEVYLLAKQPHLLVVTPSLAPNNFKEFVDYVKANPGKLNYASAGNGSSIHLSSELLKGAAGLNIVHIPYRGSGPAIVDVAAGRTQVLFGTMPSLVPQVRQKRLKAIAVSSEQRAPALPDVPTISESGLKGFTYYAWYGMFVPKGTPKAVVTKLNKTLQEVSSDKANQAKLIDQGLEPWVGAPQDFTKFVKSEIARWKEVVAKNHIKKLN
jgi:tripartite-type tricarboxylate transporter receptor subunit TctC